MSRRIHKRFNPGKANVMDDKIIELPKGLLGEFEVLQQSGSLGAKTWLLQDKATSKKYRLTPSTIEGWNIPKRRETAGPSIIVSMAGRTMVSMHLLTGEFYCAGTPPSRLR